MLARLDLGKAVAVIPETLILLAAAPVLLTVLAVRGLDHLRAALSGRHTLFVPIREIVAPLVE